jgi:hypothetical protein
LQALQTASQFAYSGLQKRLLPPNVRRNIALTYFELYIIIYNVKRKIMKLKEINCGKYKKNIITINLIILSINIILLFLLYTKTIEKLFTIDKENIFYAIDTENIVLIKTIVMLNPRIVIEKNKELDFKRRCKRFRWSRGSVLAFGTRVRGFAPGRSRRIFLGRKKSSARLPSEGK